MSGLWKIGFASALLVGVNLASCLPEPDCSETATCPPVPLPDGSVDASGEGSAPGRSAPDAGGSGDSSIGSGDGGAVCRNGQQRCSATGVPQKCNALGTAFEDQAPCPASLPNCDENTGACAAGCTPGDRRCNPSSPVIQQCDLQGLWRDTATTCPFTCSGNGATTACEGSCKPGTRSCGPSNTPLFCDVAATLQPQTPCPNLCLDGACAGDCQPGSTRCRAGSNTMVETCDATGHWGAATACTFVCDATRSDCGGECIPGSPARCSGNVVQSCDATGHWAATTTCAGTPCSGGQCRACTAAEKQCNAGKPQTCSAAGAWTDDQPAACAFLCEEATGTCTGECVPGSDACTGQVSKHCGANGTYGAGTTCPNICDATTGRCGGVCAPNAHRCNGQSAETCGADGKWAAGEACPFNCNTTTGQCNACTDEPMATTCAAGKCGATLNNCGHMVQCPTNCGGATGQTCGGGGVTGVCGCRRETPEQTCQNGVLCGNVVNNCGLTVGCASTCAAPQTCGGGGAPNECGCTPKTRAVACSGKNCDGVPDGCGGTISCGTCTAPQTCGGATPSVPNVCGCAPRTAAAACGTRSCGTQPDGCGGTASCGSMAGNCPSGQVCSNGTCAATCTPLTACPAGKNCGTVDNGCGSGTLTCGTMAGGCPAGLTCGGGMPNVCGCTPLTMATACAGKNCDAVSNGCGGTINCGSTCPANQTCGGGGTPNACGCTPLTTAAACSGKNCGSVSNGCGGMISCGSTCPMNTTCGGGGTPNVCGCTPLQSCPVGQTCGTAPNGCGNSLNCGTCTPPLTCAGNTSCKLGNGQTGCRTASDCASGPCTQFFRDADGDGFGDAANSLSFCTLTTAPAGYAANSMDCNDSNGSCHLCCGAVCTDLQTNGQNCGSCGHVCPLGCTRGQCTCPMPDGNLVLNGGFDSDLSGWTGIGPDAPIRTNDDAFGCATSGSLRIRSLARVPDADYASQSFTTTVAPGNYNLGARFRKLSTVGSGSMVLEFDILSGGVEVAFFEGGVPLTSEWTSFNAQIANVPAATDVSLFIKMEKQDASAEPFDIEMDDVYFARDPRLGWLCGGSRCP